jgi:16S rRNA (guanine1207-N2)-methyltransferase
MSHYFIEDPNLKNDFHDIEFTVNNHSFNFISNSGVFSKNELDFGSRLMIEQTIKLGLYGSVLDVGCGIGVIGLVLASFFQDSSFTLIDVNNRALEVAQKNKERLNLSNVTIKYSDIFSHVNEMYDCIITNPPIRAGKKVVYGIFEQSYDHLNDNGSLLVVIRKEQGALSAITKLETIYQSCSIQERKKGYYIIKCQKIKLNA